MGLSWFAATKAAEAEEDTTELKVLRTGKTQYAQMEYQVWVVVTRGGWVPTQSIVCKCGGSNH